jgi:hypothetical protein
MRVPIQQGTSSMDWITDDVAIGNYLEAQDAELLHSQRKLTT